MPILRPGSQLLAEVLEFAQLALDLGSTSSGSSPWRWRRSLRATTSWRTSSRSAGSPPRPAPPFGQQPLELGVDVERLLAPRRWRSGLGLEHLAELLLPDPGAAGAGVARAPAQVVLELDREPALADRSEGVAGVATKAIAATGIATSRR